MLPPMNMPPRYNGATSSSSGEDLQNQQLGLALQIKNLIGQQPIMGSLLGKRDHSSAALIQNLIDSSDCNDRRGEELCEDNTPMLIRLRAQVSKNMSKTQSQLIKKELMKAINNTPNKDKIIIEAKMKRVHVNMGEDAFRGSKYRGVSRNKNKWQVSNLIFNCSY